MYLSAAGTRANVHNMRLSTTTVNERTVSRTSRRVPTIITLLPIVLYYGSAPHTNTSFLTFSIVRFTRKDMASRRVQRTKLLTSVQQGLGTYART